MQIDVDRTEACLSTDGIQSAREAVSIQLGTNSLLVRLQQLHGQFAAVLGSESRNGCL